MELHDYQRDVLRDLSAYLHEVIACNGDMAKAFKSFWQERGILQQKYKNNVLGVPHVCVKVPTAGGKTFIDDNDIRAYLRRIVEAMSSDERADCLDRDFAYVKVIKKKINGLANDHAVKEFNNWLITQKVKLQPSFRLQETIAPGDNGPAISGSLYVTEGGMNGLEQSVIRSIAKLDNIEWWHRNLERGKGFVLNGFINHYPDFIVLTENKNLILVEAKGDDRDNNDSKDKLKLGTTWASSANQLSHQTGYTYHYMMVFENNPIEGAVSLGDAVRLLADL